MTRHPRTNPARRSTDVGQAMRVWRSQHLIHHRPPVTPAGILLHHPFTVPLILGSFVFLAVAAHVGDGALLRKVDEPVARWLIDQRQPWLDTVVGEISGLGGLVVVLLVLWLLMLLVWHECRALALTLLVASAARPMLEWTLKELVDRDRPVIAQLVPGNGPSFPSGHVMAAIAIWGLLPPAMALISGRQFVWWVSVVFSGTVILLVAFSRVYLGVHWLSDTAGALLLGALYLVVVEYLLEWHHSRRPCHAVEVMTEVTIPPDNR